jgi:hypothetical protein
VPASDQPTPRSGRVGTARSATAGLVAELGCSAEIAFGAAAPFIDVKVLDDTGAVRYGGTQTVLSANGKDGFSEIEPAIELVVIALRTRDTDALTEAWTAVDQLGLENDQLCPADPTSCVDRPACCVRAELMDLLNSSCPVQDDKATFCE